MMATEHRPQMSDRELALLQTCLKRATRVLEFGAGGSTLVAAAAGRQVLSVDSDPAWIKELAGDPDARASMAASTLKFLHVDIGPTGNWGRPTDAATRATWHRYHSQPWQHVDPERLDLVIIDGRFRVACALQAALRVSPQCAIFFHDFWSRSRYRVAQDFLVFRSAVDSVGVFGVSEPRRVGAIVDTLLDYARDSS